MLSTSGQGWKLVRGDGVRMLMEMADASVDAIITDPPYSSGGAFRSDRQQATGTKYVNTVTEIQRPDFAGDNRDQRAFLAWCTVWMGEALRVVKPGGWFLAFADWRQLPVVTDALQCGGWIWRGIVPWDKGGCCRPYSQDGGFAPQAEYVAWATRGRMATTVNLPGVFPINVKQGDKHHQTGKPTALMRRLVEIVPKGGVVCDPFAGSATTGVAALAEGRHFVGAELTPAYQEVAVRRLIEAEAAPTLLQAGA